MELLVGFYVWPALVLAVILWLGYRSLRLPVEHPSENDVERRLSAVERRLAAIDPDRGPARNAAE